MEIWGKRPDAPTLSVAVISGFAAPGALCASEARPFRANSKSPLRRRVVDATGELCETAALTAPALANDLGRDRDGGFLRCTRSKIEADWARQPSDLHRSDPYLA